jgi:hypothetical protein
MVRRVVMKPSWGMNVDVEYSHQYLDVEKAIS